MAYSRIPAGAVVALCLFGGGCLTEGQEDDVEGPIGTSEEAVTSMNRLSLNRLSLSTLPMKALSTAPLAPDGAHLAPTDLLESADGRDLLTYIIKCALPAGQQLSGKNWNKTYTFSGLIGLAPGWKGAPLQPSGQRWVTACLLAHTDGYDMQVPISLRGSAPGLATSLEEEQEYSVQEASFYGNLFTSGGNGDDLSIPIYACAGSGVQSACNVGGNGQYRPLRSCTPTGQCQLHVPGACYDITPAKRDSCESVIEGGYSECHTTTAARPATWGALAASYPEVVTVYLKPSDFDTFYGDCDTSCPQNRGGRGFGWHP